MCLTTSIAIAWFLSDAKYSSPVRSLTDSDNPINPMESVPFLKISISVVSEAKAFVQRLNL